MRRLPIRAEFRIYGHPTEKRVMLRLGDDDWSLSTKEAIHLANRLVDTSERLTRENPCPTSSAPAVTAENPHTEPTATTADPSTSTDNAPTSPNPNASATTTPGANSPNEHAHDKTGAATAEAPKTSPQTTAPKHGHANNEDYPSASETSTSSAGAATPTEEQHEDPHSAPVTPTQGGCPSPTPPPAASVRQSLSHK